MKFSEIGAIAKAKGANGKPLFKDVAYDHFAEGDKPKPPFMIYYLPESDNFSADGRVYQQISEVHYELYTDKKNPKLELEFEGVLNSHGLFYNKREEWLTQEQLFCTDYSMEVLYDA